MHPDGILAALSCQEPGCCTFCEEKLPRQHRVICGRAECRRAYFRAYFRDYKRKDRRAA